MRSSGAARKETKQDPQIPIEELLAKGWDYVGQDLFQDAYEAFTSAHELSLASKKEASKEGLYGQALCLRKLGRKQEARAKLEDLSEIERNYTGFLVKEALLYIDKRDYDQAIEPFVFEANGLVGEVRDALLKMIGSLHSRIPFNEVGEFITKALEYLPGDPGIRSEYGWLHYYAERYKEAIEKFDEVLRDKTDLDLKNTKYLDYESAIQGKVASLRLLRQFQKAEELLKELLEVLPGNKGLQSERGWLHFDRKQFNVARESFEAVYDQGESSALQWIISCLRSQRNFTEAERWLSKALTELKIDDPTRIRILIESGWLHFDRKHYDEALSVFEEALEKYPDHEFALQGKIASLRKLDRFEEADQCTKQALTLKEHRTSTGILSERCWLLFEQKKYSAADASFMEAIKLFPKRIALQLSRVEVLSRLNRSHEVENIFQELGKNFPGDVEVTERLGRFYIRQNDLKRAKAVFELILGKEPENILGLNGLGAVYVKQDRYEEAIANFRKVLQKDDQNPTWHTNLAWALVRQDEETRYDEHWTLREALLKKALQPVKRLRGREQVSSPALLPLDEAESHCETALQYDPESPDAFACLGTIAFKRGKLLDSEAYLQAARENDPKEGSYVGLGALYVHMGQYDKAEEILIETIEHNQDDATAHIELGNLYLQTGKIKEAIQKFRRALAIDLNDADALRALAIALMQADKLSEAETVIRDALRRLDESKRWRLHLTRSQLLTQRGDESGDSQYYDEALKEVNKAIMLEPNHADPYFQAGFIRCKLKDYDGALKNFRSCRSKDKDHPDAELNYMRVQSLIQKERTRTRGTFWGGFIVGALAVVQLSLLWYFFKVGKVTETILTVMIPILLGLVVVAFLIPVLIKLKLPGFEAELSERKEPVSSGPKGEIGFISSPPTISSGPR